MSVLDQTTRSDTEDIVVEKRVVGSNDIPLSEVAEQDIKRRLDEAERDVADATRDIAEKIEMDDIHQDLRHQEERELLGGGAEDFRWQFGAQGLASLTVGDGTIERNGSRCEWSEAAVAFGAGDGDYYIFTTLSRASASPASYPPEMLADTCVVTSVKQASWAGDSHKNLYTILGVATVTSSVVASAEQWVFSDIDQSVEVPDGNSSSATAPVRATIERNPLISDPHYLEAQIHDVDKVKQYDKAFPFFQPDSNKSGSVRWAPHDGDDYDGTQESLEIKDNGGAADSWSQLHEFDLGTEAALATGDKVLIRDTNGPKLLYGTLTQIDVVVNVQVTSTELQQVKRTIWAIVPEAEVTSKVEDLEECETA